ncbi:hypothetical protein [Azorhizobium doebereinerae]|uniref:hypothetical protein n=1 Tax=Azorhizobium doebereinerae TaxID=281091 RepID=UPI00048AC6ED|nr:hypothetical protein [Azorhizobium doebereinerae]
MRTFFQDFALDDGRTATVEWGWSGAENSVLVVSAWITATEEDVDLNCNESERFEDVVLALSPFPPHEDCD